MAALFERDKSVISRHLRNIYKEGELEREATVAFFATVQDDGACYTYEVYKRILLAVSSRLDFLRHGLDNDLVCCGKRQQKEAHHDLGSVCFSNQADFCQTQATTSPPKRFILSPLKCSSLNT